MTRRFAILAVTAVLVAVSSIPASAYYPFVYYLSSGNAPAKFDLTALPDKTVWFFVSETGPASYGAYDNFASVLGQLRQAVQVWNGVSSSDLRVAFGGFENAGTLQNTPAADVVFEDLPPGVLGYGGPTITGAPVTPASGIITDVRRARAATTGTSAAANIAPWVPITRSAIYLNRNLTVAPGPSYNESFFTTVVHEMGHALGLQHTFTSSAMSTATTRATSVTNPLGMDDIAGISVLYPNASFAQTGSITGRITSAGSGLHLESVVAISTGGNSVSALTNPDGTYEIDGLPQGQYFVYAHALPPDADIKGPWYSDGTVAPASGATTSLFYPGTTDPHQATPIDIKAGATVPGIDIALTGLPALPMYDVAVYGYYANNTIAIKPAYLNVGNGGNTVAASGVGLGSNGQAPGLNAAFMGTSAVVKTGGVRPYQGNGNTYIALDVVYFPFGAAGPQHLVLTTPGFMHVVPSAVRLTQQDPPTIQSVSANADGSLTMTGTNWSAGSAIYFDGLPGTIQSLTPSSAKVPMGTAIVTPPPGASGQTVVLTVYTPDGQNSQFEQAANPATYTYPNASRPSIVSISPASLPAGAEAMVDIRGSGFTFVDGQTFVGFGTSDIVVRRVFVLDAKHLQVNVHVTPGAALTSPDVSVFNGFRLASATAAFHITSPVTGLPDPYPALPNALPGLNGSYAGAIVALYGENLAVPNAVPVVTINGEAAFLLYSSPTQINLQIPSDIPSGPALLNVYNGALNAYTLVVNIDTQPATIAGISDNTGNAVGTSNPAVQGGLLTVSLSGFAPDNLTIDPSRVQVGVAGATHQVLTVTQSTPGIYQVGFLLAPDETPGQNQSLIVYLDGRSSYPVAIPLTTPDGSFTVAVVSTTGN
jgi:uncharacterized protein (TIGR03437 family)